ncbi:hypothetical protein ACQ5SK_23930 [Bradyrhizobium japonicum]
MDALRYHVDGYGKITFGGRETSTGAIFQTPSTPTTAGAKASRQTDC